MTSDLFVSFSGSSALKEVGSLKNGIFAVFSLDFQRCKLDGFFFFKFYLFTFLFLIINEEGELFLFVSLFEIIFTDNTFRGNA